MYCDDPHESPLPTNDRSPTRPPTDAARRAVRILTATLRHRELEAPDDLLQRLAADLAMELGARADIRPVRGGGTAPEDALALRVLVRDTLVAHLDLTRETPFDPLERELAGHAVRLVGDRLTQLSLRLEVQGLADITAAIAAAPDVASGVGAALELVLGSTRAAGASLLRIAQGRFEELGRTGRWSDDGSEARDAVARASLAGEAPMAYADDVMAYRLGREAPYRYVLLLRFPPSQPLASMRLPGVVAAAETLAPLVESLWRDQVHAELLRFHGGRSSDEPADDLYERLLETGIRLVHGADSGSLLIRHDRNAPFVYQAVRGFDEEGLTGIALPMEQIRRWYGPRDPGLERGRPRIVRADVVDLAALSREASPALDLHGSGTERIRSTLCLPVLYGGAVMAILNLDNQSDTNAFGQDSRAIVDLFGPPLADLLHRQDAEERLRAAASTDPLTGLGNRRPLTAALQRELARHARSGAPVGVLVMDLSGFKRINDELGHDVGDEALVRVAETLRTQLREGDVIARWGGDEFAVLLVDATTADAAEVAERMAAAVARLDVQGRTLAINVGAASAPEDGADPEELLRRADDRMYDDKRRRRGER